MSIPFRSAVAGPRGQRIAQRPPSLRVEGGRRQAEQGQSKRGPGEPLGRMRIASKPRRGVERVRRTTAEDSEAVVSVVPSCQKEYGHK